MSNAATKSPVRRLATWATQDVDFQRAGRSVLRSTAEAWLRDRLIWRLPANVRGVALTFDDGPDPDHTPQILDVLAFYEVRATFFVVGEQARKQPDLLRRIAQDGHTLGNHTDTHVRCPALFPERFRHEIRAGDATIEMICPGAPRSPFRPPYGELAVRQLWELLRAHRRVVLWSRDSRDYRCAPPSEIAHLGLTLRPRDILLMHDRFPSTVEALPRLLDRLRGRGIPAVSLADVFAPAARKPAAPERMFRKVMTNGVPRRRTPG